MISDYVVVPREILPEMSEAAAKALNKAMAGDEAGWAYMQAEAEAAYAGALSVAPSPWKAISSAPHDRYIGVFAPGAEFDLPGIRCICHWHEDAGFCVDELRYPTHWCEIVLPAPPSNPT